MGQLKKIGQPRKMEVIQGFWSLSWSNSQTNNSFSLSLIRRILLALLAQPIIYYSTYKEGYFCLKNTTQEYFELTIAGRNVFKRGQYKTVLRNEQYTISSSQTALALCGVMGYEGVVMVWHVHARPEHRQADNTWWFYREEWEFLGLFVFPLPDNTISTFGTSGFWDQCHSTEVWLLNKKTT